MSSIEINHSTHTPEINLRELDVARPCDYKLIFLRPEDQIKDENSGPLDDDRIQPVSWAFFAFLLWLPFACLYALGLFVGTGN